MIFCKFQNEKCSKLIGILNFKILKKNGCPKINSDFSEKNEDTKILKMI